MFKKSHVNRVLTVPITMQIVCFKLNFIFPAASDSMDVSCTTSSPQQLLGRRQRSDEEDFGQKRPRTTPQPSVGQ